MKIIWLFLLTITMLFNVLTIITVRKTVAVNLEINIIQNETIDSLIAIIEGK